MVPSNQVAIINVRNIFLGFTLMLLSVASYAQDTIEFTSNPFDYYWMNKKFPVDTLISYEDDTLFFRNESKIYVINFWFTNCTPCITEIPWLNKIKDEFPADSVEFIAITYESDQTLSNFLSTHPFNFKQYYLPQQTINQLRLTIGYPTTIMLDKNGLVIFQKSGGYPNEDAAKEIYKVLHSAIVAALN